MQERDFDEETGAKEFNLDVRRQVKDVIDRVLDEMGDNFSLNEMFTPYANLVYRMLTDADITQQIEEHAER